MYMDVKTDMLKKWTVHAAVLLTVRLGIVILCIKHGALAERSPVWLVTSVWNGIRVGAPFVILLLLYALACNQVLAALLQAAVLHGSSWLERGLDLWYERTRPDMGALMTATSYSVPSSYTMNATAFLGCAAYLTITEQRLTLLQKLLFIIGMTCLTVCAIRGGVAMGLHAPASIWAGVWAGIGWLLVCMLFHHFGRFAARQQT
ncbi:hypothetical protein [Ectobacillus ponti]|uniref:Phosphatidic acid phosphatase type 2/haloperoxidase domain-containing protein n=1 Tax=Ectobacillus ponti TaxID=2961894 RepID=A0AA41XBB7_9BACI|nr:hypothetical protein [Ectobacillus ponti]MCP8970340.1 hypothetical protein [Ectobacillus ponti]